MTTQQGIYRGYSSHELPKTGSFKLTDIELVKLDLLNHIFTRKGERMMMPEYGTLIPTLPFEPLLPELGDVIIEEFERVFDMDPRVELIDIVIRPLEDQNAVYIAAELRYIELNTFDTLEINVAVGTN